MIFETVSYSGNLPFELSFLNVGEESKHCHREIEILLVLRGITHYQIYHTDYELNPGDLIIADVEDLHQIHDSSDDILMLSVHIDTRRFERLYPNIRYMFFVCEECMENPSGSKQLLRNKLSLLKRHIACLAFDYMKEKRDITLLTEEVNQVVSILVNHFQGFYMEDYQYKTSQADMSREDLQRLCRITRYIMLNYKEKISLDDVSEQEHLSTYYLSHLIKENLGFNFQNFVNAIRLEFAEKLLVSSSMTLMQVSQECGFSSPNYFNKCFSAWYGKTPAQYRKAYVPRERSYRADFSQKEALDLLSSYLNVSGKTSSQIRQLHMDPDFDSADFKDFYACCAPCVILDSLESVFRLGAFQNGLFSATFALDKRLSRHRDELEKKIPLCMREPDLSQLIQTDDSSRVMEDILIKGRRQVFLSGPENAFFTPEGLKTPAYRFYQSIAQYEKPRIAVSEGYGILKSGQLLVFLLFNTDPQSPLEVTLPAEKLTGYSFFIRRELGPDQKLQAVLGQFPESAASSSFLMKRMDEAMEGSTRFFSLQENQNLMLRPKTAVILEFIP
ncbi:AraC family transcriptional regulator [bacterium 210820-DFI.6.37]|nr:AraC family transcriptional regulator [bacterium 210820-DFI.6.37]